MPLPCAGTPDLLDTRPSLLARMSPLAARPAAPIVAVGAVIGTLIYLAVQSRQNTRSIRRAAFQALINHIAGINLLATQREIAEIMIGAPGGLEGLDHADPLRLLTWVQ